MLKLVAPLGVAAAALLALASPSLGQESTADDTASETAVAETSADYVMLASDGGLGTGVYDDDTYQGVSDAPIVLIEYASLTCPHCAAFHEEGYPELKEYIDAGQLAYVYRDFPLDGAAYRAALSARCWIWRLGQPHSTVWSHYDTARNGSFLTCGARACLRQAK